MKKSFALLMAVCMLISLCACGRKKPAETTPTTVPTTTATTAPTTHATMPTTDPTLETNIPDPSVDTSMPDMTELMPSDGMETETTNVTAPTEDTAK